MLFNSFLRSACQSSHRPAADLDDERRRYYRLTAFGKRVAAAEAGRLRDLVRLAESTRLLAPLTVT